MMLSPRIRALLPQRRYFATQPHVRIGGITRPRADPARPELVPVNYIARLNHDGDAIGHLRWLLGKDALGQDAFLVGPPGPERRRRGCLRDRVTDPGRLAHGAYSQ